MMLCVANAAFFLLFFGVGFNDGLVAAQKDQLKEFYG